MVLTGIVVAIAATALALTLMLRVQAETGRTELAGTVLQTLMGFPLVSFSWVIWTILLPLAGSLSCFLLPRRVVLLGLATALSIVVPVAGLGWQVATSGVQRYAVGGWGAPLGIDLYADGLSSLMLIMTALVGLGISLYASAYFERQKAQFFWPLWLFLWAALNALFLSGDIFNLYVTLELLGLAAVALVALAGGADALTGAMRYLLVSLLGSLSYLLGVALLYHAFGSVDIIVSRTAYDTYAGGLGGHGSDDSRTPVQDGIVSAALLVAPGACQRAGAGERVTLRAGGQGLFLSPVATVAGAVSRARRRTAAVAWRPRCRRHPLGLVAGTASKATQVIGRLFDGRTTGLSVSRFSAPDSDGMERCGLFCSLPCPG